MKLYLIPVGKICNANCEFCITNFRQVKNDFINVGKLIQQLGKIEDPSYVEITGGGEPLIHPAIGEIISICKNFAPVRLYTNGQLTDAGKNLEILDQLCISRAHFEREHNFRIMGVNYGDEVFKLHNNIKLSLMLLKSGVSNFKEVIEYLNWANGLGVKKVVIRELGNNSDKKYQKIFERLFVPVQSLVLDFSKFRKKIRSKNPIFYYKNLQVELELVGCPDLGDDLILQADNKFYTSW